MDDNLIYITFGVGTPLGKRYVATRNLSGQTDWQVARGLFGERYSTSCTARYWRGPGKLTPLVLTGAVLTALRGGELPLADELNGDVAVVRRHMAQDLSTL